MSPATLTVTLQEPSARWGLTDITITPGVVDEQARELFMYALCHMLALAVCERTGCPLWAAELGRRERWRWAHMGVRTPDGLWLDIDGPRDPRSVITWLDAHADRDITSRLRLLDGPHDWQLLLGQPAGSRPELWRTWADGPDRERLIAMVDEFADSLARCCAAGARR